MSISTQAWGALEWYLSDLKGILVERIDNPHNRHQSKPWRSEWNGSNLGCAHETEKNRTLRPSKDQSSLKTLQNAITARFTGRLAREHRLPCCAGFSLADRGRSLINEEISLLTVLYFPFRARTPYWFHSSSTRACIYREAFRAVRAPSEPMRLRRSRGPLRAS